VVEDPSIIQCTGYPEFDHSREFDGKYYIAGAAHEPEFHILYLQSEGLSDDEIKATTGWRVDECSDDPPLHRVYEEKGTRPGLGETFLAPMYERADEGLRAIWRRGDRSKLVPPDPSGLHTFFLYWIQYV
jgi:hypothetical protein